MDEGLGYDKQDEVIISFNKIWDNLVRYWWVCVVGVAIALVGIFVLSSNNGTYVSGVSTDDLTKERDAVMDAVLNGNMDAANRTIANRGFGITFANMATSVIYMEQVGMDQIIGDTRINNPLLISQTLLYDYLTLLSTDSLIDEVNKAVTDKGYDIYDPYYDVIDIPFDGNARILTLMLKGNDPGRTELIVREAANVLVTMARDVFGITNGRIVDEAKNKICMILPDDNDDTTKDYMLLSERAAGDIIRGKYGGLSVNNPAGRFLTMKNVIILFVGIFFGLGVIFILILMDKKIRNKEETAIYFNLPVLGDVNAAISETSQYKVITAALDYHLANNGIKSILITGSSNGDKTVQLSKKIEEGFKELGKACTLVNIGDADADVELRIESEKKKDGYVIVSAPCVDTSSNAIQAASKVDAIIYSITANNETIPQVQKGINSVKLVGGKILGCLLIKNSKIFR